MKFRPSYYAQQQLTVYAPDGGYPGFYGQTGEAPAEEKDPQTLVAQLYKWCDEKFADNSTKRLACRGAVWGSSKLGAKALQKVAEDWFGKKVSTADTGSSGGAGMSLPSNLTASEKALIDACKQKPVMQRATCLADAIRKINADRASGKSAGGGNAMWWVLGTLAFAGVAGGVWYVSKRRGA